MPPDKIGPYLRDLRALYDRYGLEGATYGHFGQGCVHSRISFDLRHADGIERYRRFMDEAATSASPTAARSRASTVTASSARSTSRSSTGPSSCARSASSSASGTPTAR